MKKLIPLLFALALPVVAQQPANGVSSVQLNGSGTGPTTTFLPIPPGTSYGATWVDGNDANKRTIMVQFPSGTSVTRGAGRDGTLDALPKSLVGLGNVDNTSDANKPVSTAVSTALSGKFNVPAGTVNQFVDGTGALQTSKTLLSQFSNDPGFITSSALSPYTPTSGLGSAAFVATSTFATAAQGALAASALQSINSGQVTAALGFTPYNATNPSSYITLVQARAGFSLTTTGTSGAATFNPTTGAFNIPVYANSGGTVTSVTAGAGLSGGTFTTSGTISLPNTGTPSTYTTVTTDTQGRVISGTSATFDYVPVRTIQTVAAAANGWQIDPARVSWVTYSVTILSSSTLTSGSSGYVVLEIAPTNSTTASDWKEVGRITNGQNNGLIIGLALNQPGGSSVCAFLLPGYYVRLRSVNVVGTPTYTYNSGEEVKM